MGIRFYIVLCCFLVVAVCLALGACAVFNQLRFGKLPQGDQLNRIQGSPNYEDGKFQNLQVHVLKIINQAFTPLLKRGLAFNLE